MNEITLWVAVAALAGLALFPYVGYPFAVLLFPRRPLRPGPPAPGSVSVVIPARNEAATLGAKLDATLALEPRGRVAEVLVGSDGSTDATASVVQAAAGRDSRVRLVDRGVRRGKAAVITDLARQARGEFVLFTDAGAEIGPEVLPRLLEAMRDPTVAIAMPRYETRGKGGEGAYWRLQTSLKRSESERDLVVGAHGACFLARRALVPPLPDGTVNDDLLLPALVRADGGRVVYVHDASASEGATSGPAAVFRRLARISRGNWQMLSRHTDLYSLRRPRLAFPLLATKLLRILGPWLLLGAALVVAAGATRHASFQAALATGAVVLATAGFVLWRQLRGATVRGALGLLGYGLLGQVATAAGALEALRGGHAAGWESVDGEAEGDVPPPLPLSVRGAKRTVDVLGSSVLLLLTWPFLVACAVAVKLGSPGPAIFRQERVRHDSRGRPVSFHMFKFRSMYVDAEARSGPVWATVNDPRITPVGRFLRKARLDELPQLWNVLRGDMTLVGPRPERPSFVKELAGMIPGYADRVARCKPGVTGWAQIHCEYDTSIDSVRTKVLYDLAYVAHLYDLRSYLGMEANVALRTVVVMVKGKGRPLTVRATILALLLLAGTPVRAALPDPLDPALAPPVDQRAERYPTGVWVTGSMAKVRRNDPPGPVHWALLSSARNETESFQVHVRATGPLRDVTVVPTDLVDFRSGARISAARDVTVSRQLYQAIPTGLRSDANGLDGDVPDALVPARDRLWGEVRNAFPAQVAAGENLSAWIDVHVPRGIPSGWYLGSVAVRAGGEVLATVPVRLKVWNVDLPSTASLATHFAMSWNGACVQEHGSYEACGAATPSGSRDAGVEQYHLLYARFGLDRRVSIANVTYGGPRDDRWDRFDALYGPLLDGTADTRLPGARLTTFTFAGGDEAASLARWARHFREKGWLDRLVWYRCDEPGHGTCTFADARAEGDRVHAAAPGLRTLLTTDLENLTTNGLLDAVDVAVPVLDRMQPHGKPSRRPLYDAFLARSPDKRLFWYQSCDQHESCANGRMGPARATWPSYMVDASPMRNRVFQWMAFLERVEGELYYAVDYCFTRPCGPAGATSRDPFRSVYAFGGHGDGTLVYPGNTRAIGGKHHVPLSSIRLELIREGMEDYELLHLLAERGEGDFARAQAASFIRRADEFASDPARLLAAREALGDRLHARSLGR